MREFFSLGLFTVLVFGIVVMLAVITLSAWFWLTDLPIYKRIQRARREKLVNKFMEGLKK